MADSATGGPGADRTYVVHYRRKDGTEATAPFETVGDRFRYSWTAPEDCVAVTGVEETGGGGGSVLPVPGAIFSGMTVAVSPGVTVAGPGPAVSPVPMRGDEVEAWLLRKRDKMSRISDEWATLDWLLDDYRELADAGTPLREDEVSGG